MKAMEIRNVLAISQFEIEENCDLSENVDIDDLKRSYKEAFEKLSQLEQNSITLKAIELAHYKKDYENVCVVDGKWLVRCNGKWLPILGWYQSQLEQEGKHE